MKSILIIAGLAVACGLNLCGVLCAQPGTLDRTFKSPWQDVANSIVYSLVFQRDGKLLVSGNVSYANQGKTITGILRLNVDGTIDTSFNPTAAGRVVSLQDNGQLLAFGGDSLIRLNSDGSLDPSFT